LGSGFLKKYRIKRKYNSKFLKISKLQFSFLKIVRIKRTWKDLLQEFKELAIFMKERTGDLG
jgi:hypothetical protein